MSAVWYGSGVLYTVWTKGITVREMCAVSLAINLVHVLQSEKKVSAVEACAGEVDYCVIVQPNFSFHELYFSTYLSRRWFWFNSGSLLFTSQDQHYRCAWYREDDEIKELYFLEKKWTSERRWTLRTNLTHFWVLRWIRPWIVIVARDDFIRGVVYIWVIENLVTIEVK